MRKTIRTALAATAVVGLLAIPVAGATAADSSTTVSFTLTGTGNALAIAPATAGDDTATLAAAGGLSALTGGTVTGSLPETKITDTRGTVAGTWTVSVSGTNWVNGTQADTNGDGTFEDVTIPASAGVAYLSAADIDSLESALGVLAGGMTLTSAQLLPTGANLGTSYTLLSGVTPLGNGEITYQPTVDVTVPSTAPAGTYTSTITQTIG